MSLIYYKQERFEKCILFCDKILKIDSKSEKALLKKFNSYIGLKDA